MRTSADVLFAAAKSAVDCCRGEPQRGYVKDSPIIAIVFSALSCEAFINELFLICEPPSTMGCPPQPSQLSELWCAGHSLGECRASTLDKYQEAKKILSGSIYDKGKLPFQDFKLLFDVRNAIVHASPKEEEDFVWQGPPQNRSLTTQITRHHPILGKLRSKGLTVDQDSDQRWLDRISTPAAAIWACKVAAATVKSVVSSMPSCYTKAMLLQYCSRHFNAAAP